MHSDTHDDAASDPIDPHARTGQPRRPGHVVVVGGGIGGLAAAQAVLSARPGTQVTVLEGAQDVGGKLRLGEIAGVQVDLGAESMLARRPEGTALAEAVGLGPDVVHPEVAGAGVWTRGAIRPLPPTLMGIPADLAATGKSGILGRAGLLRARLEAWLPAVDVSQDVSIGALVSRRLGRDVADRLVDPLVGGVYAGRSDELSLFAAWPQVVAALRHHGGLLSAAAASVQEAASDATLETPPVFAGLSGGVGRLAVATAEDVARGGGTVRTSAMVRELSRTPHGWRLVVGPTPAAEMVEADEVVLACPATAAARLLGPEAPAAARELARVDYASMAIVTVAMRAADVGVRLDGSGFLVPPVDKTTIKAATYTSLKWGWLPEDLVVLRCSIGRYRDSEVLQRDDTELLEAAMHDLRDATGLRAPLVDAAVTRWGGALPQYAVGHLDTVARIRAAVDSVDGLEICGAVLDGVGIPAVIATGQQAASRVVARLG